jgi:hypothetical protein
LPIEKESTTAIAVTLIIAIVLIAAGGYTKEGVTGAFSYASILGAVIVFGVAVYFGAVRFLSNHVETLMTIGLLLVRDPDITKKSPQEIQEIGKKMKQAIDTLTKELG